MITIRKLTQADAKAYRQARLYCLKTYPDLFGSLYEDEVKKEKLFFEECLENKDCDSFLFGAWEREECIGLCGFVPEKRTLTRHRGELIQMFVHPNYHRQKIGEKLIQAIINEAFGNAGIEQITLGVVSKNTAAINLYKKMGFVEYGLLKNCFKTAKGYIHQQLFQLMRP